MPSSTSLPWDPFPCPLEQEDTRNSQGIHGWVISLALPHLALLPTALAVAGAPIILGVVGFTGTGIVAGSIAAKMMSAAAIANGGGVAAGSLVATLQSVGKCQDRQHDQSPRQDGEFFPLPPVPLS